MARSRVSHAASGRSASFGELSKDAAALPDGIKGTSGASGVNGTAAPVRAGIATEALPVDNAGLRVRALVTLAICGGFVYWLVTAF